MTSKFHQQYLHECHKNYVLIIDQLCYQLLILKINLTDQVIVFTAGIWLVSSSSTLLISTRHHAWATMSQYPTAAAASYTCKHVNGEQAALFYTGLYIFALGQGCLRANFGPFGGDQFHERPDAKEARQKSSLFNCFGFSHSTGRLIGLVLMVWIENNKGWNYGFALCSALILFDLLVVCSGVSVYRHLRSQSSPLTRFLQVLTKQDHLNFSF